MTHEEMVVRAEYIGQQADLEIAEAERTGGFSLKLRDVVHKAQIHKLLRPKRYGGFGMGARTFSEVVRVVAQHNASAAWLVYFTALHEQWVAFLDPRGRQEIYDSDGFTADIFFPIGKVDYVDGGVKLSGQWNWGSGVKWDDWIGLGAFVEVPGMAGGPQPCLVTANTRQIEIVGEWNPFGLRGTGSHTVRADQVFVPWHRVLPLGHIKATGQPIGGDWDDTTPIYRVPFMPMFCVGFGAIAVGVTQRVVAEVKQRVRDRQRVLYGVIEALQERYVQQLEAWDAANTPVVSEADRNRPNAWRSLMCKEASALAFRGIEMLGGAATTRGDTLEIAARDLLMLSIHVGQLYDDNMLAYGRAEYGLGGHPLL
jgi:hypothetical protein